jgi:hypothetical protein
MFLRTTPGLVLALTLLLAACGGDADAPDAATEPPATEGPAEAGESGPDVGEPAADCVALFTRFGQLQAEFAAAASGVGGDVDLAAAADAFDALAAAAPADIRADFEVMARELGPFYRALAAVDFDVSSGSQPSPDQIAAMEQAADQLDEAALEEASARIEAWFDANC